jgi:hypothetical protein
MKSRLTRTLSATLVLVIAVASEASVPSWLAPITQTAEPFLGVTHYQITQSLSSPTPYILPREVSIHIVEIDPSAPGVSFFGTPGNGGTAEEYTRQTTSAFVNNHDLAVAINGDFYTTNTGINASVLGLGMSNGTVVSPGVNGRPSFIVRQNETAVVRTNGNIPSGAYNAVSGNQRLIHNGDNVTPNGEYTTTLNPHTAIGVNNQNGHIFFMTVDGRQGSFSQGMRTDEMADILIDFGVDQAINLDGGGSSTLVFGDGPGGAARTVNSPSDGSSSQQLGGERSVANHLGIFASPHPSYVRLVAPPRPGQFDPVLNNLTVLDSFHNNEGRFISTPFGGSSSTSGITSASTALYDASHSQSGVGSQRITLSRDQTNSAQLRHLSRGGIPLQNRVVSDGEQYALGLQGYVGFFLKTTEADLSVAIGIDDGFAGGETGLEVSDALQVIADGKWHLYEWNLADAGQWENLSGGNGVIGGPNAYIDSLFFYSGASTAGETFTMFLDTVAYNPHRSLASLAAMGESGDFDLDGRVNGLDLAKWQGDAGVNSFSDADGDGDSDGADFLTWQRQVGLAAPQSTIDVAAIPEPASLAVAMIVSILTLRTGFTRKYGIANSQTGA